MNPSPSLASTIDPVLLRQTMRLVSLEVLSFPSSAELLLVVLLARDGIGGGLRRIGIWAASRKGAFQPQRRAS